MAPPLSDNRNRKGQSKMANAWVYHTADRTSEAAAFVEKLRATGEYALVIPANSRYYQGEVHRGDHVFHDGSSRALVWANEAADVPVELFTEARLQQEVAPPAPPVTVEPVPVEVETVAEVVDEARASDEPEVEPPDATDDA